MAYSLGIIIFGVNKDWTNNELNWYGNNYIFFNELFQGQQISDYFDKFPTIFLFLWKICDFYFMILNINFKTLGIGEFKILFTKIF